MADTGKDILKAKAILEEGGLVAIPTETVYGLAANALNAEAVAKIFQVKKRPTFDPLIVHTAHLDQAKEYLLSIPDTAYRLAEAFWPGPLTILLNKKSIIPDLVTSGLDRVAIRIPAHPLSKQLLEILPFPLAAPSANPFGYISPTLPSHVNDQLGDSIPYILDGGPCSVGIESTIVGFESDEPFIYRLGGMSVEAIETIIGPVKTKSHSSSNPSSPGMLQSHYAPGTKLIIGDIDQLISRYSDKNFAILSFQRKFKEISADRQLDLSPAGDLSEAAQKLFTALRDLDKRGFDIILTQLVPDTGLGRAINDRLRRAAFRDIEGG